MSMIHTQLGEVLDSLQEEYFSSKKRIDFINAFERISLRYRERSGSFLRTEEERKAYLFTRLPGTFAAVSKVLEEIKKRHPSLSPDSFLDVGAGPGTGMWAALEIFETLSKYTLLEKDPEFMSMGKDLAKRSTSSFIQKANWKNCDLEKPLDIEPHDLILLSYSIGEIKENFTIPLLASLWTATKQALIIVEPGTPAGYLKLMKIRDLLKDMGGHLWAPCPHSSACPLSKGDWCHFSIRVQRSALHRQLKSADLGYEDEKFSYLIFGKEPIPTFQGRILRHLIKHPGQVEIVVCKETGIQKEIYSKKNKEQYKQIKKLDWGDFF